MSPSDWCDGFTGSDRPLLWPALMPCHLLPLIGNGQGDFLCVRCADDGTLSEVVHWFHGGGDWIPWGRTLADAILIDALSSFIPGSTRRHVPIDRTISSPDAPKLDENSWLSFAHKQLGLQCPISLNEASVTDWLIKHSIGTAAVWSGILASKSDPSLASATLSPRQIIELQRVTDAAVRDYPSLAWTWEGSGLLHEKSGQTAAAVEAYDRGARCSVFTSQSVRLGTHGNEEQTPKFSITRLQDIAPERVRGDDYFRRLTMRTHADRQNAVHSYWMAAAGEQTDGSPSQWFCLHMAAWDLGLPSMQNYADVLRCIAESAEIGGADARAAVARVHLDVLCRHPKSDTP